MLRIVVDLGNSRVKWGRLGLSGDLDASVALPTDGPAAWADAWELWNPAGVEPSTWAVATVNPPAADRLDAFFRSAWNPRRALVSLGGRRAFAARPGTPRDRRCRSRLRDGGGRRHSIPVAVRVWSSRAARRSRSIESRPMGPGRGGRSLRASAFPPGRSTSSRRSCRRSTSRRLPRPGGLPPLPALAAGVFWGVVGSIRELLERQATDLLPSPWLLWTGGDAPNLAPWIAGDDAHIVPDLVLQGLARVAHGRIDR